MNVDRRQQLHDATAQPRARLACALIAAAGALLRIGIALRPLPVLDTLFIPDDTYYTLGIARSLARGLGASVDGVHLTNGFQPLIALLMVPVYALTRDPDLPVRCVLLLLAALDGMLAYVLGELARRTRSGNDAQLAALASTTAWAASPLAISYALGGLETTLALLIGAGLVLAFAAARHSRSSAAFAGAGVLAGLALLARIDLVFLVGMLGAWELVQGSRRDALIAAGCGLLTVAPFFGYELAHFGSVIPESGQAVREQVSVHQARYLSLAGQVAWAIATVWEAALGRLLELRALFRVQPIVAALLSLPLMAAFGLGLRAVPASASATPLRIWLLFCLLLAPFYAFYVPALWFFPRYLAPLHAALCVLFGTFAAHYLSTRPSAGARRIALAACALCALAPCVNSLRYLTAHPHGTLDSGLLGAKGYRQPAQELLKLAPRGAVLGALQSGALGYYAFESAIRVVNLDGVVDRDAATAFRTHTLATFARARGVTHLCDWQWNIASALERSGDPSWTAQRLHLLGEVTAQGTDRFALYALP